MVSYYLCKSLSFCYEEIKDTWKLVKERGELSEVKIQLESEEKEDEHYSQDLDEKLEQFNWKLIKACASRRLQK